MDEERIEKMATLFVETGQAHHQAFIETDGADPDWPIWYANHLKAPLGEMLDATLTTSDLTYLLITAVREQEMDAPGANWSKYYARFFIERYG